jgi:hypothetical protein
MTRSAGAVRDAEADARAEQDPEGGHDFRTRRLHAVDAGARPERW